MALLELLGVGAGDHAWALRFLQPVDGARLVVALLEGRVSDARERVRLLRFGDAPLPPLDDDLLLGEAASYGCWRALTLLLNDLRAKSPPWVTLYDDTITDDVEDLDDDRAVQGASGAHRGTHYRFGHDVVQGAAAQGHLKAVQWLLRRSAESRGQVEPRRRDNDDHNGFGSRLGGVLQAAAEARQLHVVEWIVKSSSRFHCILPHDDELEAICWIVYKDVHRRWCDYFCATKTYGFSQAHARHAVGPDGLTEDGTTDMPLADGFARDGDLATLKTIRARDNYRHLIGLNAIVLAAERGHLEVVQWLYEQFPRSLTAAAIFGAARGGYLDILRWIKALGVVMADGTIVEAAS